MRNTALVLILALQSAMCASNGAVNYVPWKDPLSKDELDALMRLHYTFERERGDEAKKAHEATVSKYGHTIERRTNNKVILDGVPQN